MPCYTRRHARYWRFTERTGGKGEKSETSEKRGFEVLGTSNPERHWPARLEQRESTSNRSASKAHAGGLTLEEVLGLPAQALGMVIFAHGSDSGQFSPRNNFVAHHLQNTGDCRDTIFVEGLWKSVKYEAVCL